MRNTTIQRHKLIEDTEVHTHTSRALYCLTYRGSAEYDVVTVSIKNQKIIQKYSAVLSTPAESIGWKFSIRRRAILTLAFLRITQPPQPNARILGRAAF
jgi:hypothetical protein